MRVALDLHELHDIHGARCADSTDVIAREIDEHQVLGTLLLIGQHVFGQRRVVLNGFPARTRTRNRMHDDMGAAHGDQRLGR
jgi:hypothetical protein